jgi:ElaB/YqjD/DUF883 family membrane-anchored ribosome-binding protein
MIIMDEQRAIEKTASELKTIQNRLNKLLKQKQSAESQEIANLKSIISNFRSQIDDASGELHSKEYQVLDLESQMVRIRRHDSTSPNPAGTAALSHPVSAAVCHSGISTLYPSKANLLLGMH